VLNCSVEYEKQTEKGYEESKHITCKKRITSNALHIHITLNNIMIATHRLQEIRNLRNNIK